VGEVIVRQARRASAIAGTAVIHAPSLAWAEDALVSDASQARTLIVLTTIVAASLIGVLLYRLSLRSSQDQYKKDGGQADRSRGDLKSVISKEVDRLAVPPDVAKSVSDIIAKTVDQQVDIAKKELNERYGRLIEEQRRSNASLQNKYQDAMRERKQTVSVLESIAEGLVVVNNKGEVVMMNPAAEKLLAVDQKDRIGKSILDNPQEGQLISMTTGTEEEREVTLSAKSDATKRVLRASNAMITDEDGKTVGMVAVLSDVTKQRELDQLKSEFVSKVSHELRTPIVAMQHALSILVDEVAGPLTDEQKKFTSLTQRNLQRLNGLINDLLDLSKLEAKKMELRLQYAPLAPVIATVCDTLEAWAQSKAIALSRRVPENLPNVMCDPARVTQVVTNLVGNAIKFTPKQGRITVEARLADGGSVMEISVADTGIGIAKDDLPKLFSKFQQVGERTASDITGTGLGLAISKEIVELHQGRIWAESDEARKGTTFKFTLPLEASAAA
jgi:PAS domain S-box-containing protein